MDDQSLLDVAATWSFWETEPHRSIPRSVKVPTALSNRTALIVQGVRRSGKSTLLTQLIDHYQLVRRDCLFVNFEDPRLAGSLNFETLERLIHAFGRIRSRSKLLTIFLDEIQWVEGWDRWLRSKLERPGRVQFVLSGSNAHLLSTELSSSLTGRHITVELFPFDLHEYKKVHEAHSQTEYLYRGGFPEVITRDDSDILLQQYFLDILLRDVRERVRARSSFALRQLVQMVFESTGSEFSLRRIASACDIAVETAATYLDACEQAYLLFACPWFAYSERKRAQRNRKYYPIDTALRRVVTTRTGEDIGKSLECATFIELKKRYHDVFYWRGKGEVDFVVQTRNGPTPVQVTKEQSNDSRWRSLEEFYEVFPHATEPVWVTTSNFPEVFSEFESLRLQHTRQVRI